MDGGNRIPYKIRTHAKQFKTSIKIHDATWVGTFCYTQMVNFLNDYGLVFLIIKSVLTPSQTSPGFYVSTSPLKTLFLRVYSTSLLKTLFLRVYSTSLLKTLFLRVYSTSLLKTLFLRVYSTSLLKTLFLRVYSTSILKTLFLRVCSTSLLKTLWEKEKLLVTSNFSFSHSVVHPFGELSVISIKSEIVVCKLFQFGRV